MNDFAYRMGKQAWEIPSLDQIRTSFQDMTGVTDLKAMGRRAGIGAFVGGGLGLAGTALGGDEEEDDHWFRNALLGAAAGTGVGAAATPENIDWVRRMTGFGAEAPAETAAATKTTEPASAPQGGSGLTTPALIGGGALAATAGARAVSPVAAAKIDATAEATRQKLLQWMGKLRSPRAETAVGLAAGSARDKLKQWFQRAITRR